ncbi:hypothetical protein EDI_054130 [Entamoeba dispar SAW760]|uniref:Uncharacterized protein n=1 Tax=Entamoeba dispar (strain ATCC PRA-260 / SAW760) TaxID=370354 RepID=B0EGM7_ENTDS|nr:uncharacterized protein EDI_054130 [Entamoeba dispar SAW760]EDR26320.1 hypothetical protein EDI_054130 [Entamoeba dispar SAW760]|eukprot:EDR26320.1 hypothetical protein EDI_054130 [Entamoeba dispar SAW760]
MNTKRPKHPKSIDSQERQKRIFDESFFDIIPDSEEYGYDSNTLNQQINKLTHQQNTTQYRSMEEENTNNIKTRQYIKIFLKHSSNLNNSPKYKNLIYVNIPSGITDYKHGDMFSKITKELETYTGEKNKAKIAALKKALGNYPTILGTIEPSIDDLNTKIMNGLNEFSKLTNMKGNGLFYLIDPKGGVNTIDLLISNIIITIQRRIIMMDGKENAKDDKFKVEEYYGKPGKKFKKSLLLDLKIQLMI